jgi:hypothetical protein
MTGSIKALLEQVAKWKGGRHPKIFISYRRHGEGAGYGGRLADKLVEHFGAEQCFRDVANIESGVDFVKTIHDAVSSCEVLIAVIGPDWTTQTDQAGNRRLHSRKDFVRLEVASALERDIRVIPVLVGGAEMPAEPDLPDALQGLSRRQAQELSDSRWDYDVARLLTTIESIGIKRHSPSQGTVLRKWKPLATSVVGGLVVATALISLSQGFPSPSNDPAPVAVIAPQQTDKVELLGRKIDQQIDQQRRERAEADKSEELERMRRREMEGKAHEAETKAADERDRRHKAELALKEAEANLARAYNEKLADQKDRERQEKELAAIKADLNQMKAPPPSQPETTVGINRRLHFMWTHEGIVYDAVVAASGIRGIAVVNYVDPRSGRTLSVEQDLELLRNAGGAFYVGSNPRFAGTSLPVPGYRPDIFKLALQRDDTWTISEAGDTWDHFDRVVHRQ